MQNNTKKNYIKDLYDHFLPLDLHPRRSSKIALIFVLTEAKLSHSPNTLVKGKKKPTPHIMWLHP